MNTTATPSTPNPGGTPMRRGPSRIAKEDPEYYPKAPRIQDIFRKENETPERLATRAEVDGSLPKCVKDAVLEASPNPNKCADTGAPDLHGRIAFAHVLGGHTESTFLLRTGTDLRSCGRSIYVHSYANVVQLDVGPHNDFDAHLYARRPLKEVCNDILDIAERNSKLPVNSPDRVDVWDKYPPGVHYDLEYVPMGRKLHDPHYQNDICVGTRAGDQSRPLIKSHTAPGNEFLRFVIALRVKRVKNELDTCGIPADDHMWSTEVLKRATALGWFDPIDAYEMKYLVQKGVLDPNDISTLRDLKGRGSVSNKPLKCCIMSPDKLSKRDNSYLVDVLHPTYIVSKAPARNDRLVLKGLTPTMPKKPKKKAIPSDKLVAPAFPRVPEASDSESMNSTQNSEPTSKFKTRTIGSNTLVASQTTSTPAARVPKRGRESNADNRATKKGKTVDNAYAHKSSSPNPFVGSSPDNSSGDSPQVANTFKAMLRSKGDAPKGRPAAAPPKGQQAVAARHSVAPGAAQSKAPQPAAAIKDKPSNASIVPKSGFAFKMPSNKTVLSSNAPYQAKSMQPAAPAQSVARNASQPALRPPSTSRIPGPSTSKIPVPSAASSSRRVIDRMKPKPEPKSKPPKA
ncbi:hypothetical protein CYLTODRAFT_458514 [Cylindrobasidium torrendii FP15055 ss-10]|uniref:Uncharacterized protein n=1 Tax=Cylindrobasidium torrendii FP15055 ss-10 TaxID=1314674 RepID=A0A0D7AXP4_9AGAR|nr:hypothetical protein CYLTODRAFT_458514 [Cylindrobasidium torrendii FP15055 ss-10]